MDLLQITIIVVLVILTLVVVSVGVYFIFILKEFRETLKKTNGVLDDVQDVTGAVSTPIATMAGIISGLTDGLKTIKSLGSLFNGQKEGHKKGEK